MKKITKKEIKSYFKAQLATSAAWAIKGMLKIYEFQTNDEKAAETTRYNNDVGFSGCDANILSSFCQQIERGRTLSPKQMALVFKKMPKYWSQLLSLSDQDKLFAQITGRKAE